MQTVPAGTSTTVTIPFVDLEGNAITPTALSYRLLDEQENVVQGPTSVAVPGSGASVSIVLLGSLNTLALPGSPDLAPNTVTFNGNSTLGAPDDPVITTRALREVELTMTTAQGAVISKTYYIVASPQQLILMQNSFQTYNEALLTSSIMPPLMGWSAGTEDSRSAALINAYRALTRLGYFVRWPRDPDAQNYLNWFESRNEIIIPRLWDAMTVNRWFNFYPEQFRVCMRRAQIIEADNILSPDAATQRRLLGITSERVGESAMTFRNKKSLDFGVSSATMREIANYVDIRITLTRS